MTIRECLAKYRKDETELFLAHLLNYSRAQLYTHYNQKLTDGQVVNLLNMVKQARQGVPVAYLLGYKYFLGKEFKVNRSVLIPRPESEWLVEQATRFLKKKKLSSQKVLDLGTGSGCLGISLKLRFPKAIITLADISKKALAVAKSNSTLHKVKVKLLNTDLFAKIPHRFDLIFANLPYVPSKDYQKFHDNLRYEPKMALVDKQDYRLYLTLLEQLTKHLTPNGLAILEIDPSTKPVIENWLEKHPGIYQVKYYRDLKKLWRYCLITLRSDGRRSD